MHAQFKFPMVLHCFSLMLLTTWLVTTAVYLLSPFESLYGTHFGLIFSWIFVFCYLCLIYSPFILLKRFKNLTPIHFTFPLSDLRILFSIALLGLLCHYFDKFYVRNYEFSGCLSSIREAWLNDGIGRATTVFSVWSALGHLLPAATAPAALILLSNFKNLKTSKLIGLLTLNSIILLLYAMPIGSRSIVTIYLAICLTALTITWAFSKSSKKILGKLIFAVVVGVGIPYTASVAYLFYDRISCNETNNYDEYFEGYEKELLISKARPPAVKPFSIQSDTLLQLSLGISALRNSILPLPSEIPETKDASVRLAGIYFSHGLWNFESNIHNSTADQLIVAAPVLSWISRILPIEVGSKTPRTGKGSIALPGMLWISHHALGILLGAIALAGCTLLGVLTATRDRSRKIGFFTLLMVGTFLLISPIGSAAALLWFPFAAFASITYAIIRSLIRS